MSGAAASLICRVSPNDELLLNCVKYVAAESDRPARPLHLQALLQIPRIADANGLVSMAKIEPLLRELAQELPTTEEWIVKISSASPRLLGFNKIDVGTVQGVLSRFHYLRSPRRDGRAYGLTTGAGQLVALCVTSPLDVEVLRQLLKSCGRFTDHARVLSRVFAFEGAPTNSISYMLSKVATEETRLGVTDLLTYVNPNMGFTGVSYRASGWRHLGDEAGTTYRYLDARYITERELSARFGKHDDAEYNRSLGDRYRVSVMKLEPLLVFHTLLAAPHPLQVSS
jgi:hypothetical protein